MAADTFCIESMVHGYHEYLSICNHPLADRELVCKWEAGNLHDPQAVAIKMIDGNLRVVGHVPSRISSIFIRRGGPGTITCRVTGDQHYSVDLPQGGLELPCVLTFSAANTNEHSKTKKVFESTLSIETREAESKAESVEVCKC